jgi:hypothetical protein
MKSNQNEQVMPEKNSSKNSNSKLFSFPLAAIIIGVVLFSSVSSCSKTNANAEFLGTYTGTRTVSSIATADTLIVTAGSNSTSIVITDKAANSTGVNATVNSNAITIPNQAININGAAGTISGTGGLGGSALSLNYTEIVTATSTSYTGTFNGTKQ